MKKFFAIFIVLFFTQQLLAQRTLTVLNFNAILNGINLQQEENLIGKIKLSEFKFYVSKIVLIREGKVVYREKKSFHLIDLKQTAKQEVLLKTPKKLIFDEVSFILGIDSTENHKGVQGGDLDPSKGMYWAWQSGYINLKLEANIPLKEKEVIFHLGGFLNQTACDVPISLKINKAENIYIVCDLDAFFEHLDLKSYSEIMTPGKESVYLMNEISKVFFIKH